MWEPGKHCNLNMKSSYDELAAVKGKITMEEAQVWFAKYCKSNPRFTVELLTGGAGHARKKGMHGVRLELLQDLIIRALFVRDATLIIAGRGFSKSYLVSIFVILYAIFYPGCKIGICSGTFRQSKLMFKQIEKFIDADPAGYLRQCLSGGNRSHASDAYELFLNGSSITALPLTEKIRGYRFNVMIIDELALVPQEIITTVIEPFLSVLADGEMRSKVIEAEDILIAHGKLKEEDRLHFPNNKIIGMSSASYKFQSLYKDQYVPYIKMIHDETAKNVRHAVFRLSYEVVNTGRMDKTFVENAKKTASQKQFQREYEAIFTDESDGYFSAKHIEAAKKKIDETPKLKLVGDSSKWYVLGIDPNYTYADTSDNFAMCLIELHGDGTGTVVHNYALANSDISKRAAYLKYLVKNFKIAYVIVDSAGGPKFISDAEQIVGSDVRFTNFEPDFDDETTKRESRMRYNLTSKNILHSQPFGKENWLRISNETLAADIENRRITFGSVFYTDADIERAKTADIPILDLHYKPAEETMDKELSAKKLDFAIHQNDMLDNLISELLRIEPSETASGSQRFDLPKGFRKDAKDPRRPRKDSYTALLLACWGMHCYYDLMAAPEEDNTIFVPCWVA